MAENILTIENIVKTYKMGDEQQTVLKGIDLQVDKGEFVAILGPSGSGKSTLMNIIGCLDTATSGTYHLHGRDVSALSESELARVRSKEIGFIFQSFQLLQRQDALQNVELPLIYAGMRGHARAPRAAAAWCDCPCAGEQPDHPAGGRADRRTRPGDRAAGNEPLS